MIKAIQADADKTRETASKFKDSHFTTASMTTNLSEAITNVTVKPSAGSEVKETEADLSERIKTIKAIQEISKNTGTHIATSGFYALPLANVLAKKKEIKKDRSYTFIRDLRLPTGSILTP